MILQNAVAGGACFIRRMAIQFATVLLDNIRFRLPEMIASLFSNKVIFAPSKKNRTSLNFTFYSGPCQSGYVVNFGQDGRLECAPSECPQSYFSVKPLIPMKEYGICYELGTTGPCNHTTELIGYDVFELRAKCVDVTEPLSPYFSSQEEENSVDDVYDQLYAEYDPYRILFVYKNQIEQKDSGKRRQGQNTLGSFQVSSSLPDVLLNPCRPGAQNGYNAKCINPIL